ncbi:MAG: aldo/keto reductase [Rhodoluna sp.]
MSVINRKFGRTGWDISEVSFGAWQLGGQWGPVDDNESIATLIECYESGINFVDTAQMYGLGHSETIVGKSLREWGNGGIKVATKAQPVAWPPVTEGDPKFSELYPSQYLIEQVEGSLKRLGVERLDLYQLHCWAPDGLRNREWLETLSKLRDQGKIDKIGVSIRDYRPEDGVELAGSGLIDSIQVIYNIFEQEPEKALFPAAAEGNTAIIARVALDSGSLSGLWNKDTYSSWDEGSVLHTFYRDERFGLTLKRIEAIKDDTSEYYEKLAEVAVRFVLDRPEVSTAILGMSNSRRIQENLSYSDGVRLPRELRKKLASHEWRRNYYV